MYWKELTKSYAWFNDAIATQALAIEAYHEIENDTKSVQQLKTWLLRNKKTKPKCPLVSLTKQSKQKMYLAKF